MTVRRSVLMEIIVEAGSTGTMAVGLEFEIDGSVRVIGEGQG